MFAFLLCILLVLMLWKYSKRLPASFPPGPRSPLPVVGDAYILKGNLSKGFGKLHHKYGDTFGLFLGRTKTVVTRDFELAKEILAKEALQYKPVEGDKSKAPPEPFSNIWELPEEDQT